MTHDKSTPAAGGVSIGGSMTGSFNTGAHGVAVSTGDNSTVQLQGYADAVSDERYQELLEQVRLLRQQLPLFAGADGVAEVEAELVETEEEITRTGEATPGLLRRLWDRLEQASTALGGLSSALTLAEAVRKLTG